MIRRVAGVLISVLLMLSMCTAFADTPTIDPNAGKYIDKPQVTEPPVQHPLVVLPGWAGFTIPADTVDVEMYMPNPAKNEGWYHLAFEVWAAIPEDQIVEGTETKIIVKRDDDGNPIGEVVFAKLYESGLVPPGMCLQFITLLQPMAEGLYEANVHIQPYYVETMQPVPNSGTVDVYLNVVKKE